jgi:DNA modification methylase
MKKTAQSLRDQANIKGRENPASLVEGYLHTDAPLGNPIQEWRGHYAQNKWRLFNGPAKETLRLLPKDSVDCVITSPPYFWLRDYKVNGQLGMEDSVDGYVVSLAEVMAEVYRVLKPDGVLFLNIGDTYYSGKGESQGVDKKSSKRRFGLRAVDKSGGLGIGLQRKSIIGIPWRVATKMCQQNWILRSPIIWNRLNCLGEPVKDRPSRGYEYIFMFVKSRFYHFNRNALQKTSGSEDVWSFSARPKLNGSLETAPFPDELVTRCLEVGCRQGGLVLDPFCGSGTTLRVGLRKGFNVIGVELSDRFCKYVVESLASMPHP